MNDDIIGLIAFDKTVKGISEKNGKIEEYVRKAKQPWDALSEDLDNILADMFDGTFKVNQRFLIEKYITW